MHGPDLHDIHSLEKEIENAEGNDHNLHQLYNNLGFAFTDARLFSQALDAHREEKQACARILRKDPKNIGILLDMAIAYRRCGDATMRVKKLRNKDDQTVKDKRHILSIANMQHIKGLKTAKRALEINRNHHGALLEVQAATASVGLTAVELGIETKNEKTLRLGACVTKAAALLARKLPPGSVTSRKRKTMLVNAANNCALALNALEDHKKARNMFTAVAVHAKTFGDQENYMRAVANLVDARMKECDFDAAKKYARMWAQKANDLSNYHEEATAQLTLGRILGKLFEYDQAKSALRNAMLLFKENEMKKDASDALKVVEDNIKADKRDAAILSDLESKLLEMNQDSDDYDPALETTTRKDAGNIAHTLRRYETCIDHLQRFMELIETKAHVCAPHKIDMEPGQLGKTIANLADACWKRERFSDAVKWGREELLAYGDEKAGQAQAWCNLGNYLCDYGRVVDGIEGLKKSIALAKEAGEHEVMEAAQINLDIELEKDKERQNGLPTRADEPVDVPDNSPLQSLRTANANNAQDRNNSRKRRRDSTSGIPHSEKSIEEILPRFSNAMQEAQQEMDESPLPMDVHDGTSVVRGDGQNSIVVCSNQALARCMDTRGDVSMGGLQGGATSSGVFSVSRPHPVAAAVATGTTTDGFTKSHISGAISSAATGGRYKDVADAYKRLCRSKRTGNGMKAREGLLEILRKVAADAMFDEEEIAVDFSGTFIQDHELRLLLKAVGSLDHSHGVKLNLARNPFVSHVGYRTFLDDRTDIIRELDISGSGIHPKALLHIAAAIENGSLAKLARLCASKNSLGKHETAAAKSVAKLATTTRGILEEIDLSMNRLAGTFLRRFVEQLEDGSAVGKATLQRMYFQLNNTRSPNAFLEDEDCVEWIEKAANMLPNLNYIDVRSCGASASTKNALYKLSREENCQLQVAGVEPSGDENEESEYP